MSKGKLKKMKWKQNKQTKKRMEGANNQDLHQAERSEAHL